jgi:PIN domain nuclease of toxin-antitoxin system
LRLLLDTHIWLWSHLEPERLRPQVAAALESPESELWLSPISVWETLVLAAKARLDLEPGPVDWVARALEAVPLRDAPLNREVAVLSRAVDLPHDDPADRFLVATAQVYGLTLVTADDRLRRLKKIDVLPNR